MERRGLDGQRVAFYQECVVPSVGVLGDALDADPRPSTSITGRPERTSTRP
jgi:hypothetical protein